MSGGIRDKRCVGAGLKNRGKAVSVRLGVFSSSLSSSHLIDFPSLHFTSMPQT